MQLGTKTHNVPSTQRRWQQQQKSIESYQPPQSVTAVKTQTVWGRSRFTEERRWWGSQRFRSVRWRCCVWQTQNSRLTASELHTQGPNIIKHKVNKPRKSQLMKNGSTLQVFVRVVKSFWLRNWVKSSEEGKHAHACSHVAFSADSLSTLLLYTLSIYWYFHRDSTHHLHLSTAGHHCTLNRSWFISSFSICDPTGWRSRSPLTPAQSNGQMTGTPLGGF